MKCQVQVLVNKLNTDVEVMRRNMISQRTYFCKITRFVDKSAASNSLLEISDLIPVTEENSIA